jgi:hypothetical protein
MQQDDVDANQQQERQRPARANERPGPDIGALVNYLQVGVYQ